MSSATEHSDTHEGSSKWRALIKAHAGNAIVAGSLALNPMSASASNPPTKEQQQMLKDMETDRPSNIGLVGVYCANGALPTIKKQKNDSFEPDPIDSCVKAGVLAALKPEVYTEFFTQMLRQFTKAIPTAEALENMPFDIMDRALYDEPGTRMFLNVNKEVAIHLNLPPAFAFQTGVILGAMAKGGELVVPPDDPDAAKKRKTLNTVKLRVGQNFRGTGELALDNKTILLSDAFFAGYELGRDKFLHPKVASIGR